MKFTAETNSRKMININLISIFVILKTDILTAVGKYTTQDSRI